MNDPQPLHLHQLVLTTLARHGVIPAGDGWRAALAPGGSTERTFTVLDPAGEPRWTARLARPGLDGWLRREETVLRELERGGGRWFPRDARLLEDDALPALLLIHRHVPGEPGPAGAVSVAAREQLGAALAAVHAPERAGYIIWPDLVPRAGSRRDNYRARLASLRAYASLATLPGAAARLAQLELSAAFLPAENGWDERTFALLHGDLSRGNILWQGDAVALIDWEYARDGDPAEDLASLIVEGQLAPEPFAEIAECYVAAGGDPWAPARLGAWLPLVALDAALWWADWSVARGLDPLGQAVVRWRLARAGGEVENETSNVTTRT